MIIGLCGPEGAGKSTAARVLKRELYGWRVPMALPLKRMAAALGVPRRAIWGTDTDKRKALACLDGKSSRHALQTLGTEWGRLHMGDAFWINRWRDRAFKAWQRRPLVLVDDVRFVNEAEAVRDLGGFVVCIVRSTAEFKRVPKHPSEDFMAVKPDYFIVNDGDTDKLQKMLMIVVGQAIEKRRRA